MAVGVERAVGVVGALLIDPTTQLVAIDRVGQRDTGVPVTFDVAPELPEALLPPVGVRGAGPAGQLLESALTIGLKGDF